VVAHPNCIDPEVFDPARFTAADISALRAKLGIARDAVVAGFVGTFGQWHGVNILAEAVRRLALENADWLRQQRVHFLIVGDGLLMSAVRQALADDRCRPFCTLTGLVPQAEAPAYMAAADVLLSPHIGNPDGTRFFGSPTKLFEYMAMGKGIVASDLEQIGQVLRPGLPADRLPLHAPENGEPSLAILGKPGSVDDLVRGIRFLVEQPRWRQVLGDNARAEALKRYTWDRHVDAILQRLAAV
jgi:glycosyltransferase involved in cell wall biosynthesis